MKKLSLFLVSAALLSATAMMSGAAEKKAKKAQGPSCQSDIEKFCKGVDPTPELLSQCLMSHQAELSESCQAKIEMRKASQSCQPDIDKFCGDVKNHPKLLGFCLQKNKGKLSPACQPDRAGFGGGASAPQKKRQVSESEALEICKADIAKFCPGMEAGDPRLGKCMAARKSETSSACRALLGADITPADSKK